MTQWTDAERFLLERVRQRDGDAWAQLVARYEGRLVAFARARGVGAADAEDFVQDAFLHLLRGLEAYRGEASLETYLFLLLRRRIVEWLRGRRVHACLAGEDSAAGQPMPAAPVGTASSYVRRAEELDQDRSALAAAIAALVEDFRRDANFRDLQLVEMLFYAQMRNNAIAGIMGLDEKYVALLKHRWIKQLRAQIDQAASSGDAGGAESLLSEVWEEYRPSCPKRSTLGGYLLGTLEAPWHAYVEFHVQKLGCRFCSANLDDIRKETAAEPAADQFRNRVMQSSAGFFHRA
jgi:RNA polymerase sigma factor (sigma-70 family)